MSIMRKVEAMTRRPGFWLLAGILVAIAMASLGCNATDAAKMNVAVPAMADVWPNIRADAEQGIEAQRLGLIGEHPISDTTADLKRGRLDKMERALAELQAP